MIDLAAVIDVEALATRQTPARRKRAAPFARTRGSPPTTGQEAKGVLSIKIRIRHPAAAKLLPKGSLSRNSRNKKPPTRGPPEQPG